MTYFLPDPNVLKDQRRFDGLMITVLRTALFREIKVCLIGRNGRACSQSFYQENILVIKTFCPFVLLSKIIIVLLLLCLKTCSSVENSAFREMNGKSTGYVREIYGICLSNISRPSNPLHIGISRKLRDMLAKKQFVFPILMFIPPFHTFP